MVFPLARAPYVDGAWVGYRVWRQRSSLMGWACSGCHHAPSPAEINSQRMASCPPSPKCPPEPLRVRVRPGGTSDVLGSEGGKPVGRVGSVGQSAKIGRGGTWRTFPYICFLKNMAVSAAACIACSRALLLYCQEIFPDNFPN